MAIASLLASIANWSTPTIIFCVLNLTIATIFIASNFKSPNHQSTPGQLTGSHDRYESTEYNSASQHGPHPSLLQRVRSIDFSLSSFHNLFPSESERQPYSLGQLSKSPSLMDRVKSFKLITSGLYADPLSTPASKDDDGCSDIDPHRISPEDNDINDHRHANSRSQLSRTPSLLDRVRSFKLITSPFNSDQLSRSKDEDERSNINPHLDPPEDNNITDRSETSGGSPKKRLRSKLSKSETGKEVATIDNNEEESDQKMKFLVRDHDASVDAKAGDFIKRFKQQLKLQRLDSLQRLREMLHRGT